MKSWLMQNSHIRSINVNFALTSINLQYQLEFFYTSSKELSFN